MSASIPATFVVSGPRVPADKVRLVPVSDPFRIGGSGSGIIEDGSQGSSAAEGPLDWKWLGQAATIGGNRSCRGEDGYSVGSFRSAGASSRLPQRKA